MTCLYRLHLLAVTGLAGLGLTGLYHRTSLSHCGVPGRGDRSDGRGEESVGEGGAWLAVLGRQQTRGQDVVLVVLGGRGQQRERVVVGRMVVILASNPSTQSGGVGCSCLVVSLPGIGVHYDCPGTVLIILTGLSLLPVSNAEIFHNL